MGGWKKFEPFWNFMIQYGQLNRMLPVLESLLANTKNKKSASSPASQSFLNKAAF